MMDETTGTVLLLVGAAIVVGVGYWLRVVLTRAATRAVVRTAARGTHKRGQAAVHTSIEFTVPGTGRTFLELVKQRLVVPRTPPAIQHDLYLEKEEDNKLVYEVGSKLATSFRYVIAVADTAQGSEGLATVTNWTESYGLVNSIDHVERLERHVIAAVETMGGTLARRIQQ